MNLLEINSLAAEAESIKDLINQVPPADLVSKFQLGKKLERINIQLAEASKVEAHHAQLAVLFGGKPVFGSSSILAGFASKALSMLDKIINQQFSFGENGFLPERGRVRFNESSNLAITGLAHQSFGFVLEETNPNAEMIDSGLSKVVEQTVDILSELGAENYKSFEDALDKTDPRQLSIFKEFFKHLSDSGANLRFVENEVDKYIDEFSIERARSRIENVSVEDIEDDKIIGKILGITPLSKKFDIELSPSGEPIKGSISQKFSTEYLERISQPNEDIIGKVWQVKMKIREINEPNKPARKIYTLLELIKKISSP